MTTDQYLGERVHVLLWRRGMTTTELADAACRDWAVVQDALGHASMDTTRRYVLMPDAPAVAAVRSLTLVGGTQIERT